MPAATVTVETWRGFEEALRLGSDPAPGLEGSIVPEPTLRAAIAEASDVELINLFTHCYELNRKNFIEALQVVCDVVPIEKPEKFVWPDYPKEARGEGGRVISEQFYGFSDAFPLTLGGAVALGEKLQKCTRDQLALRYGVPVGSVSRRASALVARYWPDHPDVAPLAREVLQWKRERR